MQLKTILNRVEYFKSFVYGKARWVDDADRPTIEVNIEARKNGRPICSGCGQPASGYDRLPERRFEFVPLWGIAVFFVYAMRRVECPECGVKVEQVPWCDGKHQLTTTYRWFLAGWAKRLSWQQVAWAFGTSWQNVYRSVKHVVSWGLAHRDLDGVEAIGVDEIQWQRGHKYLTLVYQIDEDYRRLLWAGKDRTTKTILRFFRMFGKKRSARLAHVHRQRRPNAGQDRTSIGRTSRRCADRVELEASHGRGQGPLSRPSETRARTRHRTVFRRGLQPDRCRRDALRNVFQAGR